MSPAILILLITGHADLPHHHWQQTTAAIRSIFDTDSRFELRVIEDPRAITADALTGYKAIILNYNGPRFSRTAEKAIEDYIRNGGGFVAFHQAAYGPFFGDNGWPEFPKIIAASWQIKNIGHARRWAFQVDSVDGPPWMANDELYHRIDLASSAKVVASAMSPKEIGGTGRTEPLAWTNTYGNGRVFFTALGHDTMAFHQPGMQRLFTRGVEWAATGSNNDPPAKPKPVRVLTVTGGHSYPKALYGMLDSIKTIEWAHATSQQEAFSKPLEGRYDVILLHDLYNITSEQTRQRLTAFVEAGKGIVSLHHAIVDYTDWPWWYEQVTGGKYFEKPVDNHAASHYREGVDFLVTPVKDKQNHPVLRGVGPLLVHDEMYRNMWFSPKIEVLMEIDSPENDKPAVYIGPHPKARSVYIQLGHSAQTMQNPGFRRLIENALLWVGRTPPSVVGPQAGQQERQTP